MAIKIQETFQVKAPINAVWQFMMTPEKVVTCMPGAGLDEGVDERSWATAFSYDVLVVLPAA